MRECCCCYSVLLLLTGSGVSASAAAPSSSNASTLSAGVPGQCDLSHTACVGVFVGVDEIGDGGCFVFPVFQECKFFELLSVVCLTGFRLDCVCSMVQLYP